MTSVEYEDISVQNVNTVKKKKKKKKNKKKKKKSHFFAYLYLFSFVFLAALLGLSYLIKSYSPDIDVTIGDNEAFTLNDADVDIEMKTVDERLKWIQMEDDLPTVSIRGIDKPEKEKLNDKEDKLQKKKKTKEERVIKPPAPSISEIKQQSEEFKNIPTREVIPRPKPAITKVYLGNYATIEEAAEVQAKVSSIDPSITPFIKPVKGHYIVQLGSFSDGERAGALAVKLRAKGFYPKVNYEN